MGSMRSGTGLLCAVARQTDQEDGVGAVNVGCSW